MVQICIVLLLHELHWYCSKAVMVQIGRFHCRTIEYYKCKWRKQIEVLYQPRTSLDHRSVNSILVLNCFNHTKRFECGAAKESYYIHLVLQL